MSTSYETFGKYVLLEKLATGGMAEVFLARGIGAGGIGKFFAIKRILPQYADSPEFIDMFKSEAKIAINLSHSNIVSIHEFGVEKGQFFLVMDYVEGRNLRQILNKMKKTGLQFSIDQIVYMIKEVAAGLDHAHRCIDGSTGKPLNITHRDMSPQNVMVSFEGEVRIVDFGIAKAESELEPTRTGTLKGKFGYMSPEQAEGQPVDLRTDIFSLGIVLWELLANDRLFVANNEVNTLRKIRDCQIPSLRKINPNIHSELERIVQKGLARDRNLRYQTGAALHRDLNRFLNRQYPDFSPQDFSVFIKSVFADEILSLRKRLVDYAKININVGLSASQKPTRIVNDDDTSLLNNVTDSLVVTATSSDPAQTAETLENSAGSAKGILDLPDNANPDGDPRDIIRPAKREPSIVREISVPGVTTTRPHVDNTAALTGSEDALDISHLNASDEATQNLLPPTTKPGDGTNAGRMLLDDRALEAEAKREITVRRAPPRSERASSNASRSAPTLIAPQSADGDVETEDVSSPNYRVERRFKGRHNQDYAEERKSGPKPARLATFLVFTLMCLSAYAYLVKYFTPTMADVIRVTDPVLHDFHAALGVNINEPPRTVATSQPSMQPQPATPLDPQPVQPQPPAPFEQDQTGLVVTSNPSGAEIFLNGQTTGMVTPSRIEVPPQQTFTIIVRKRGYHDFKRAEVTRESVGHRLDATMQKMNIGWVNVEIFPPQDAVLYVNGKQVPLHRNTAEVSIPGNQPVKFRAESRSKPTYDEATVSVSSDGRKSIRLNPRKMSRTPSNSQ